MFDHSRGEFNQIIECKHHLCPIHVDAEHHAERRAWSSEGQARLNKGVGEGGLPPLEKGVAGPELHRPPGDLHRCREAQDGEAERSRALGCEPGNRTVERNPGAK